MREDLVGDAWFFFLTLFFLSQSPPLFLWLWIAASFMQAPESAWRPPRLPRIVSLSAPVHRFTSGVFRRSPPFGVPSLVLLVRLLQKGPSPPPFPLPSPPPSLSPPLSSSHSRVVSSVRCAPQPEPFVPVSGNVANPFLPSFFLPLPARAVSVLPNRIRVGVWGHGDPRAFLWAFPLFFLPHAPRGPQPLALRFFVTPFGLVLTPPLCSCIRFPICTAAQAALRLLFSQFFHVSFRFSPSLFEPVPWR